jgi:hypothetical protein
MVNEGSIFDVLMRWRLLMGHWRLGTALLVSAILLFCSDAAPGFEGKFKLPCMISYNGKPSFVVMCTVTIRIKNGYIIELAETPNSKIFIIENDKFNTSKWYLNHEMAVKTSEEPNPCFRNDRVQVCL